MSDSPLKASGIVVDKEAGTLSYPVWHKRGGMLVNRDCLDADDPNQTYNFLSEHGIVPEDYGIECPLDGVYQHYKNMTRGQLIQALHTAHKELEGLARAGFYG
mgnify:FL=1|jgi:hypothetical protein